MSEELMIHGIKPIVANSLYLRLVGTDKSDDSAIPLDDLAKTLLGFEQVLQEFARICRLNGEIVVTAKSPEHGSFLLGVYLNLNLTDGQLPFDHVRWLLQFLKLTSDTALREAHIFFKEIDNLRDGLNLYCEKHPFDMMLFTLAVPKLITIAKRMKKSVLPPDDTISKRVAGELHTLIRRNGFKNLLAPIVNESVESIEVSPDKMFNTTVGRIDNNDFDQLLGTENEILPELKDGEIKTLIGIITSLKSTRGDSLTFQYIGIKATYYLDLLPPSGSDSKSYRSFYKENVVVVAKVERASVYKKPKLRLINISLLQSELFDESATETKTRKIEPTPIKAMLPYKH